MSSVYTIGRIRKFIAAIQTNTTPEQLATEANIIADNLQNPYLLCLPNLFAVANQHNIDVSCIQSKVARLKNDHTQR